MAPLTGFVSVRDAISLAFGLNLALLAALPMIAARLAFDELSRRGLWLFCLVALTMMIGTHSGLNALRQGQPQILAAFLTLLDLERADARQYRLAGGALGFAIALKLSPLPVALIWIVAGRGRERPALIALGTAMAIGLASVAIAGWPLHRVFLDQLGVIGRTLMINLSVASMDMIYGLNLPAELAQALPAVPLGVPTLPGEVTPGEGISWVIASKPTVYAGFQSLAQLVIALAVGFALRIGASRTARAAALSAALAALAFTGPIG